ncbi:MAG: cytochrome c [Myxococcaceae bacterium]
MRLLFLFLLSSSLMAVGNFSAQPKGFSVKGDASKGKELFQTNCALCHGSKGNGKGIGGESLTPKPANFTDAALMKTKSDWELFSVIKDGGAKHGLSPSMASYQSVFTEQNIKEIIQYIRTFAHP